MESEAPLPAQTQLLLSPPAWQPAVDEIAARSARVSVTGLPFLSRIAHRTYVELAGLAQGTSNPVAAAEQVSRAKQIENTP